MEGAPKNNKETLEKVKISQEDGIEVLQNIEITEKNAEMLEKMAEIEVEMKKRRKVLKTDPDTGEVLKEKDNGSEFQDLKQETWAETEKELTRENKYAKGGIIPAILALGFVVDATQFGPVSQSISDLLNQINVEDFHIRELTHFAPAIGALAFTVRSGVKSVAQALLNHVASNQKVQRIIAMIATEQMDKTQAQKTVSMESRQFVKGGIYTDDSGKKGVWEVSPNEGKNVGNPDRYGGFSAPENYLKNRGENAEMYFGFNKETLDSVRNKLDEMGINRISREKYKGTGTGMQK